MPRVICEAFAEASGECGRLVGGVEVRNVAYGSCAEMRDAFLALLGVKSCYSGRRSANVLPDSVGRAVHQVREKHSREPEMTNENYGVVIRLLGNIRISVSAIAVLFENSVKIRANVEVFFVNG